MPEPSRSGKPSSNVPFIMPARLASTDANEQIKEVIGSGPYKFVKAEWQPGNQVVYERFADYVPRNEAPSGAAGGKRANVDRVIARYIPDAATASAALEAARWTWWDNPPVDFCDSDSRRTRTSPCSLRIPAGLSAGAAQPPVPAVQQQEGASGASPHGRSGDVPAGGGRQRQGDYYRTCPSYYMCGLPGFRNTWSMPACSPSRAVLFEGRYPMRTNVLAALGPNDLANSMVGPFEMTAPKLLKERDYE